MWDPVSDLLPSQVEPEEDVVAATTLTCMFSVTTTTLMMTKGGQIGQYRMKSDKAAYRSRRHLVPI